MNDTSESGSVLPWLWVIEALAGFKEISSSTLQDLIEAAPVKPENFGKNTRELVALRCLEGLFGSANAINGDASSICDSRIGFEFSQTCEDVLRQILHKIPSSNLRMAGAELLKWDVLPFIMHKRASAIKCDLNQVKKSILEGTCSNADYVKERSGLAPRNQGYPIPVNNGKYSDLMRKDNESQPEQEIHSPLKEPNAASLNGPQQPVASNEAVVNTVNGCGVEISSDSDGCHNEKIDLAAENLKFLSSRCTYRHDLPASECTEKNICVKCNEGGQLLVCKTTTCPIAVHESCIGITARFDADGKFFCPFCTYSQAVSELREAKKKVSLAREEQAIFVRTGMEHQATELLDVHTNEQSLSRKSKQEHLCVKNNEHDLAMNGDNGDKHGGERLSELNHLEFQRSQQEAEAPASCDNVNPSRSDYDHVEEPDYARDTDGEEISEDECKNSIPSPRSTISRKRERQDTPQANDLYRRRRILWTAKEEEMLREGMQKFEGVRNPWNQILKFGSHVFSKERKAENLKDKWKNMSKARSKSK